MTDVKELVPELFYSPEILVNHNRLPLGARQRDAGGAPIDDVVLPAWAHGDPAAFVRAHRAALESEAVSRRLHAWVDLIFGEAQRGPKAAARHNVFYHLTYEGAVDVEAIEDEDERAATRRRGTASPNPSRGGLLALPNLSRGRH